MCGLFFSAGLPFDPKRLDVVEHRGPDGRGVVTADWDGVPVVMAHRRLAIIDLTSNAAQPMQTDDGRYTLIFNGAIYNYQELAKDLVNEGKLGPSTETLNDTKVLLAGLVAYGTAFLDRLCGMFAFVFTDHAERTVLCARDRFGIKPLYFTNGGGAFGVGSEIKQLLDWNGHPRRVNPAVLHDFLKFGVADHSEQTFFENIFQVLPGHFVELDFSSGLPEISQQKWYDVVARTAAKIGAPEFIASWKRDFDNAVGSHLVADVTIGSCLSGGLDSSAIVSTVAQDDGIDGDFQVFTATYPDEKVDESNYAKVVMDHNNLRGTFVRPTARQLEEEIGKVIWFQEEPFGSTSIFAQWCVFQSAAEARVKVMLDGQGADEILHGYFSIFPIYIRRLIARGRIFEVLRAFWRGRDALFVNPFKYSLKALSLVLPKPLAKWVEAFFVWQFNAPWLDNSFLQAHQNSKASQSAKAMGMKNYSLFDNSVRLLTEVNLPMMLHWEDRNSMAHSIEARDQLPNPSNHPASISLQVLQTPVLIYVSE